MAARFCPISLCDCPGVDSPITNISAEAPDPLLFWGQIWNPYNPYRPPPLGDGPDVKVDCDIFNEIFSIYDPIVYAGTQLMANLQALAISLGCPWPTSGNETFQNDEQTATVYCPDGSSFSYTVNAGTLTSPPMSAELGAIWVIWANAWAQSYALQQASALMDCVTPDGNGDHPPGPIPPTPPPGAGVLNAALWTCSGDEVNQSYTLAGASTTPYNITLVSGSLPPGTSLAQTGPRRVTLSGFPTTPGVYNFTIRGVTTTFPTRTTEAIIYFFVMGISNSNSLPAAEIDIPYSESLIGAGGTSPYTFALDAGSFLPSGLSLSSNGTISGTTSDIGTFDFDVVITDANGGECTVPCSLSTFEACTADTGCNRPVSFISCVLPPALTISDWNSQKLELIAPAADLAGAQAEWDGTLPIQDLTSFFGWSYWVPAGSGPYPGWAVFAFNGLKGTLLYMETGNGVHSHHLVLQGSVGGVNTIIWEGRKTVGENPIGTIMRTGGLSSGPECFHVTGATTPHALAWWTLEGPNPLINTDAVCGLQLVETTGVVPDYSIVAGHVNNAVQIDCGATVPGSTNDDLLRCANAGLKFNGIGTTICGWINISDPIADALNSTVVDYVFDQNGTAYEIRVERVGTGANWVATFNGIGTISIASAVGWHFFAITFDAITGDLGFDIDQSGMTTAFALIPAVGSNVTGTFLLTTHTEPNKQMTVIFDEFTIYDGVLTTAQLDCIYNGGTGRTW